MSKKDMLCDLFIKNEYVTTSEVERLGISRQYFLNYAVSINAVKVSNGIYRAEDAWTDYVYQLSLRYPQAVLSYESSLYVWNLMEREPVCQSMTVKRGYNATGLRKQGVEVHNVSKEVFLLGKTQEKTNLGHLVSLYDMERTICDIVKAKDKMDIQVFSYAIKNYMRNPGKNICNLFEYAKILKCENEIRKYTEVLL